MDPVSLTVISMAATAASSIVSGVGQYQSGQYQAAVARNNAIIAEQNAQFALQKGQVEAENQNYKTRAIIGQQKANEAAAGIDVNSGSALEVRSSTAELGHLDALTILNNAAAQAAGYRAQKMNFEAESALDKSKAGYGLASSLIGGGASLSDKWLSYQQKGILT